MAELGYIQLNCSPTGSHGLSQTTQAKTIGCSLQTGRVVLLPRITPPQLTEHGESLDPYILVPLVGESILQSTNRKM